MKKLIIKGRHFRIGKDSTSDWGYKWVVIEDAPDSSCILGAASSDHLGQLFEYLRGLLDPFVERDTYEDFYK